MKGVTRGGEANEYMNGRGKLLMMTTRERVRY